jgi:hypothetical protein
VTKLAGNEKVPWGRETEVATDGIFQRLADDLKDVQAKRWQLVEAVDAPMGDPNAWAPNGCANMDPQVPII